MPAPAADTHAPVCGRSVSRNTSRFRVAVLAAIALSAVIPAAANAAISTTQSAYGDPIISEEELGTTIDAQSPPAGLYVRATLDPTKRYRVLVHGDRLDGSFVMRVRRDRDMQWQQAPDGLEALRVDGVEDFELLVYRNVADTGRRYRLRSVVIEPCACEDDSDLRDEILEEVPQLGDALDRGDDYGASELLLRWASPRIVAAGGDPPPVAVHEKTAAEIYYDYFATRKGGVYCGGAAAFLHKVLDLFGLPNYIVEYGDASFVTHATVVVPGLGVDGSAEQRLLDPTFGMTLRVRNTGRPLDIGAALELRRADLLDHVVVETVPLDERIAVYEDGGRGGFGLKRCGDPGFQNSMCGLEEFALAWRSIFAAHGLEPDLGGLLAVLGRGDIYRPEYFGTPEAFTSMQATFRRAVAEGHDDVHVSRLPLPPLPQDPPRVVGDPVLGATVTATAAWRSSTKVAHRYKWQRCTAAVCKVIEAPDGPLHVLSRADVGFQIRAEVTATNVDGERTVETAPTATVRRRTSQSGTNPGSVPGTPAERRLGARKSDALTLTRRCTTRRATRISVALRRSGSAVRRIAQAVIHIDGRRVRTLRRAPFRTTLAPSRRVRRLRAVVRLRIRGGGTLTRTRRLRLPVCG